MTPTWDPPGALRIAEERKRQLSEEGWSIRRDVDVHQRGQLVAAAICYAYQAYAQAAVAPDIAPRMEVPPDRWPWDDVWWKPSKDPVRNLEKAGALIAAEIDRLQFVAQMKASEGK